MAEDNIPTYAVVDMSKKKKNRPHAENSREPSMPAEIEFALYSAMNTEESPQAELRARARARARASPQAELKASSDTLPTNTKGSNVSLSTVGLICLTVAVIILSAVTIICFSTLFTEVASLKSQSSEGFNDSTINELLNFLQFYNSSIFDEGMTSEQMERVNGDAFCNGTQSLNATLDDIYHMLFALHNQTRRIFEILGNEGEYSTFPSTSCAALPPSSPSGYYWVRNTIGSAVRVYCDMTRSCGGVAGGWTRVASLDITDSSQQCPSGLSLNDTNRRTCVADSPGCSPVMLPMNNLNYSQVCGRIIAYQFGAPNAFEGNSIDSAYVDGVSLTHGSPRQHIWTFVAALDESGNSSASNYCPCIKNTVNITSISPPPFVVEDYFCDTGSQRHVNGQFLFYSGNPLWDGAGCGAGNSCCNFNSPPWFYKQLPQPTTDDIEMRVCRNGNASNEDIAIEIIEIYIQ